jgi:hypothetical protein
VAELLNLIRYKGIALTLDGEFAMKTGVEPDVNSFTCAADDFAAKLLPTYTQAADLEFFFTTRPGEMFWDGGPVPIGEPDVKFAGWRMVSCTPLDLGETLTTPPTIGPVKWRIRLADFRERFVLPRGGRLMAGVVNAKTDKVQLPNSQLVRKCLAAMGVAGAVPDAVDRIPAPQDLKWQGSHAAKELEELLDRVVRWRRSRCRGRTAGAARSSSSAIRTRSSNG